MLEFSPIGIIRNEFAETKDPDTLKAAESRVIVDEEYADGLDSIEESEYLKIVFHLHKSDDYTLIGPRRYGGVRGLFASRTPNRPNPIGVTLVKLIERQGRELLVTGLDAIDKTPLLDIKPYAAEIDAPEEKFSDD
ncbi:tRNA (N6-threonylcarbamoyladenosine(37)-N6)-methyltransferase TrmO [Halarsenatibacter silvermanii]|uniref:tRNA-Thr(GGU) m(6)t(6)A37 methyltransferase TsaA n=1 Tax=Halarsenatibacter silvermanii TaxID=321763 RepID=A0A1G9PWT7_9FIRM|nr:tRNA (N6-threonylcarbamoyladenosine(37)-N6)-methyltransferase TrmO [Halarsenatibacter silvermanii]SDM02575.1 tRNA-Thr(GGU) m(6)t(6)A37 methyltransferase TsaA [Halarsenatibacter silvermanii]